MTLRRNCSATNEYCNANARCVKPFGASCNITSECDSGICDKGTINTQKIFWFVQTEMFVKCRSMLQRTMWRLYVVRYDWSMCADLHESARLFGAKWRVCCWPEWHSSARLFWINQFCVFFSEGTKTNVINECNVFCSCYRWLVWHCSMWKVKIHKQNLVEFKLNIF